MNEPPKNGKFPQSYDVEYGGAAHRASDYITGWRLTAVAVPLGIAVFLVTMEISIVATALVSIGDSLHAFDLTSWIVTAYLLTYNGFLIIFAKISDLFGRKQVLVFSLFLFIVFSGACATAKTATQLIILRTFQGIGGSGSYSIIVAIFFELVRPARFPQVTSLTSVVFALAFLVGPLMGGAITQLTTWRWVFLINVPSGLLCLLALLWALPNNFPHHNQPTSSNTRLYHKPSAAHHRRIDLVGTGTLLAASVLLVTGLEQAKDPSRWKSPLVIVCLAVSSLLWFCFFAWSRYATNHSDVREPVFPWRLVQSRIRIGMLISIFTTGMPFTVAIVQIPLRFQAVNSLSPLQAGLRLLPYAFLNPIGSAMAPLFAKRMQTPLVYILLFGAAIQVTGSALLSTVPTSSAIPAQVYVYQGLVGFGTGINLACLIVMTPFAVEKRDKAVAMSAMVQFRTLGGALGLAIVTTTFKSYIHAKLLSAGFTYTEITTLLKNSGAFSQFPIQEATSARRVFAEGYNLQMKIATAFCGAQIIAAMLLWKKPQFTLPDNP